MGTNDPTTVKHVVRDTTSLGNKPVAKKFKSQLVKVTVEEINAVRPSVYKYLLP